MAAPLKDYLKSLPFYFLPHHLISWMSYHLGRIAWEPVKRRFIRSYLSLHALDMSEALLTDPYAYKSLNALFTRALKPECRPFADGENTLLCPVDGTVSQAGVIEDGRIFQAKGRDYSLLELVGGNKALAEPFMGGRFATLYLSPVDYHRVHMPLAARLSDMLYVPGRLFSVAPATVRAIPRLFARNERLVCRFDTAAGPMALVMVGAINVSAIDTVWAGAVTPPSARRVHHTRYRPGITIELDKGAEMGRFNLGSTVIVLMGANTRWDAAITPEAKVRLGQALGHYD